MKFLIVMVGFLLVGSSAHAQGDQPTGKKDKPDFVTPCDGPCDNDMTQGPAKKVEGSVVKDAENHSDKNADAADSGK